MKFPAGPSEDARYRILREFLAITDDYATDSKLGPLVRRMQSDAMRMAMISSLSYPQTFSLTEQQEKLTELNTSLQNAASQLLAATRHYALFE